MTNMKRFETIYTLQTEPPDSELAEMIRELQEENQRMRVRMEKNAAKLKSLAERITENDQLKDSKNLQ